MTAALLASGQWGAMESEDNSDSGGGEEGVAGSEGAGKLGEHLAETAGDEYFEDNGVVTPADVSEENSTTDPVKIASKAGDDYFQNNMTISKSPIPPGLNEKQPKYGEIGMIEDGLDHELEEVTFIPGTQIPDDGTSSAGELTPEKETRLEDIDLEAENEFEILIPGTAVPDNAMEEEAAKDEEAKDVVFLPGQKIPEIGLRVHELEARWREAEVPQLLTPQPPKHKISWGEQPTLARQHTWHGGDLGVAPGAQKYSWDMWPGPCPEVPRYIRSMDLPEVRGLPLPGLKCVQCVCSVKMIHY